MSAFGLSNPFRNSGKKPRIEEPSAGSSGSAAGSSGAGASSGASGAQAQQSAAPQSFAQAARGASKRQTPALSPFPRPPLVRAAPVFQHDEYESMERPAPPSVNPSVLYVDMRQSALAPETVLDAAYAVVGQDAVGFQVFSAQKTLALVFSDATHAAKHRNQTIGDTGLLMYAAPPTATKLVKLTLQGVPVFDVPRLITAVRSLLQPYGELVFLAAMVRETSGWLSDQWHATFRVPDNAEARLPSPLVTILDAPVIIDVPGERRYCRHCMDVTHTKSNCRQGQRVRARQQQLLRQQQQFDQQQQLDQQQPLNTGETQNADDAFGSGYSQYLSIVTPLYSHII